MRPWVPAMQLRRALHQLCALPEDRRLLHGTLSRSCRSQHFPRVQCGIWSVAVLSRGNILVNGLSQGFSRCFSGKSHTLVPANLLCDGKDHSSLDALLGGHEQVITSSQYQQVDYSCNKPEALPWFIGELGSFRNLPGTGFGLIEGYVNGGLTLCCHGSALYRGSR